MRPVAPRERRVQTTAELLERESELESLGTWFAAMPRAGGCVVLVSGEAGIGKTSLVRQFTGRCQARVLWGACDAFFTPHPFGPVRDIARQVGGPLLATLSLNSGRELVFAAALDELERGKDPVVAVFEDVHWADEATLDLLKFLGRRVGRSRAMLVVTYREEAVDGRHPLRFVTGDLPHELVRRIRLAPLSAQAVAAMARGAGRDARALYDATGGNPFFVTEVLAAGDALVPASVRDAVLARLAQLSERARDFVELASAVPGRIEPWLLERLDGIDEALGPECQLLGMRRGDDGSLAFRHELARRAIEDSLSAERQRALHARVFGALAQASRIRVAYARLAHHAERAGDAAGVLRFAAMAGDHAARLASHREAAAHYRNALRHAVEVVPEEHASLLDRLAYECFLIASPAESAQARAAALEIWRSLGMPLREGDELRWLSRLNWFLGCYTEAERYALDAVRTLEPLPAGPELAMAYSNLSQLRMLAADGDEAILWGEKAVELARRIGNLEIESHALNNVGTARLGGPNRAGQAELARSLELALAGGWQEHVARAYTNIGTSAVTRREYAVAMQTLDAGIKYCEDHDLDAWTLYMRAWRGRAHLEAGNWSQALHDAEAVAQQPGCIPVNRVCALIVMARVRIRRGEPGAPEILAEARRLAIGTQEPQRICPVAAAAAEFAWLQDDREAAIRDARWGLEFTRLVRNPWPRSELTYWLWKSGGDVPTSVEVAEPVAAHLAGDHAAAAAAWQRVGCPYEEAMALAHTQAEDAQRRALQIFESLGAQPMAARVRQQLRAQGVRDVPRGARASTRANPHGLTRRELQILEFVAQGMRNAAIGRKLFVSPKTVDHHVAAILAKLGVSSRGEAARAAHDLGLTTGAGTNAADGADAAEGAAGK